MLFLYLTVTVFVLDRISKIILTQKLFPGESVNVIEKIFYVTYVRNTGSAFGLFPDATKFFIWVSIISIILIVVFLFYIEKKDFFTKVSLTLIMSGALGNLFDRLMYGYVIDFIDVKIWPVFNLADLSISIGCLLLITKIFLPASRKIL